MEISENHLEDVIPNWQQFEKGLQQGGILTGKMVSTLTSFDRRLMNLEECILPIHHSTQKLTRMYDNIDRTLKEMEKIMTYFDLANRDENFIHAGPQEDQLNLYLTSMQNMCGAMTFLIQAKLKNPDGVIVPLRNLLNKAIFKTEELLRKLLMSHSTLIDPTTLIKAQEKKRKSTHQVGNVVDSNKSNDVASPVSSSSTSTSSSVESVADANKKQSQIYTIYSADTIKMLHELIKALSICTGVCHSATPMTQSTVSPTTAPSPLSVLPSSDTSSITMTINTDNLSHFLKILVEYRTRYLSRCMHSIAQLAISNANEKTIGYVKGSCALLKYGDCLIEMLKLEKLLLDSLMFGSNSTHTLLDLISTPLLNTFVESARNILDKAKRLTSTHHHDYSETFILFDCLNMMVDLFTPFQDIFSQNLKKMNLFNELVDAFLLSALRSFADILADTNVNTVKYSKLPDDGTVFELSSNTLNYLKRLEAYRSSVCWLLQVLAAGGNNWEYHGPENHLMKIYKKHLQHYHYNEDDTASLRQFSGDLLHNLFNTLSQKAKQYKKPNLDRIFLINNYHYVIKTIHINNKLKGLIGPSVEQKAESVLANTKADVLMSWRSLKNHLIDNKSLRNGKSNLSTSERQSIKDSFKCFNSEFEDLYKTQTQFYVPDQDLCNQLISDIKGAILPSYTEFLSRVENLSFSKDPQKHIKWTQDSLGEAIDGLFGKRRP